MSLINGMRSVFLFTLFHYNNVKNNFCSPDKSLPISTFKLTFVNIDGISLPIVSTKYLARFSFVTVSSFIPKYCR